MFRPVCGDSHDYEVTVPRSKVVAVSPLPAFDSNYSYRDRAWEGLNSYTFHPRVAES